MRLFLNPGRHAYLRELSDEFGVSSSQVSEELQQLTKAGLLTRSRSGRQIHYRANTSHALFPELHSMVKKALGMDRILESILERLGNLRLAFLIDDYAVGKDSGLVDLLLVGAIDAGNLADLVRKTEKYIERKIRTLVLSEAEYQTMKGVFDDRPKLLIWDSEKQPGEDLYARSGTGPEPESDLAAALGSGD